eukprot:gene30227-35215_t
MAKPLSWFTDTVAKDEEVNDLEKEDVCLHDWVAVPPGRKVTDIKTLAEFEALYGNAPTPTNVNVEEALTQLDILRTEARRVAVFNMAGTPSYVATNAVYNFYGRLTTALDTSTYNAQQSLCTSEANEQ